MQTSACFLAIVLAALMGALPSSALAEEPQAPAILAREEIALPRPEETDDTVSLATVNNGERETVSVPVVSWRDLPYRTVTRQAYDYSCGSAAVATLLTHVYGAKTSENDVFQAMFRDGDQDKIRTEGFSLLDMSSYLNNRGFRAVGFKLDYAKAQKTGVPFIALVNNDGYNHFVVVKSMSPQAVLVGDPNKGNVVYPREVFEKLWNGVALIVTNNARKARLAYADDKDWRHARATARFDSDLLTELNDIHTASMNTQIAPTGIDILNTVLNTGLALNQISVQTR